MPEFIRPAVATLRIACLAVSFAILSAASVLAQGAPAGPARQAAPPAQEAPFKQIALTEKQVAGVLAAAKEMDPIVAKLPDDGKPDPKVTAQLDRVAKKNGFASYDDYNDVIDNINLVLEGFDPATKKYVGAEAVIKAQIAQVQADTNMPAKDKKEVLAELDEVLKSPTLAVEHRGNIDLVTKYYDRLNEALSE